jgi:hypothetical protein
MLNPPAMPATSDTGMDEFAGIGRSNVKPLAQHQRNANLRRRRHTLFLPINGFLYFNVFQ